MPCGFLQGKNVAAVESRAELLPVLALVMAHEYSAVLLVIDKAGVERVVVFGIDRERGYLTMSESHVRSLEACAGVVAGENAAAIGREHYVIGIANIYEYVVDDHIWRGDAPPPLARVRGLKQTFSGPRVNHVAVLWILLEHASSSCRKGNALNLVEELARALALVNAGAGAGINNLRLFGINDYRENIGVVDDSILDVVPRTASVGSLPRQMPGSGVDRFRIVRINGNR